MTPTDREALAERFRQEARRDKVIAILRVLDGLTPTEALAQIDSDPLWWSAWRRARVRRCPSVTTRAIVREAVRARLPPLAEVFRDQLEELEAARQAGMEVWKP